MAEPEFIATDCDGTITFLDGAGSPVSLEMSYTQGDWKIDGVQHEQREVLAFYARGVLKGLRYGDPVHPTLSGTCMVTDLTHGTDSTPLDFLRATGAYTGNVTQDDGGEVFTVGVRIKVERSTHGMGGDNTVTCGNVHLQVGWAEGRPSTLTWAGTIYGDVEIVKAAS
jgi:hypothetical protein